MSPSLLAFRSSQSCETDAYARGSSFVTFPALQRAVRNTALWDQKMGCGGSTAAGKEEPAKKDAGPIRPGLKREESTFVRRTEANRGTWSIPGESNTNKERKRTRSASVDFSGSGQAIMPANDDSGIGTLRSGGAAGRARAARGRSQSVTGIEAAVRVHGWVVAKEEQKGEGRKAGRIAVRAEGNIELRTQLARNEGKHEHFTPEEATFVLETIGDHFLFRSMSAEQQTRALQHFQRRKLAPKEVLVRQGDDGAREMFIVHNGFFDVHVQKSAGEAPLRVAQLNRSAVLGEMALLYACKRTATVTNISPETSEVRVQADEMLVGRALLAKR